MPDLPDFQLRRPDPKLPSFAEAHPFAPVAWDPTRNTSPAPGLYAKGMSYMGEANARANASVYDEGSHGAINAAANRPAAPAAAPAPAGVPDAPPAGRSATGLFPSASLSAASASVPGTSPASMTAASALDQAGQAGQLARFNTSLRDTMVNLNPEGQAPGDFNNALATAKALYERDFGGSAPGGTPPASPIHAYAPTGLRDRALEAGKTGGETPGIGDVAVSGKAKADGGSAFTLRQTGNVAERPVQPAGALPTAVDLIRGGSVQPGGGASGGSALQRNRDAIAISNAPDRSVFASAADLESKYPAAKYDYTLNQMPDGRVVASKISPRGPNTMPNVFANTMDQKVGEQVADVISKVPDFNTTLEQVKRARVALDQGAKTGGSLADLKLSLAKNLSALGVPGIKTAPTELAKQSFSDFALAGASRMKGQGQITEPERALIADTVASLGNSPEAARAIMSFMESVADRNLKKAQALQQLRDAGVTTSPQYSRILTNWETDHPLPAMGGKPSAPRAPAAPAAAGGIPSIDQLRAERSRRNATLNRK